MMVRSKDHRSAGLWWSLLSSSGSLGGHGRLRKSFRSLIITFVPTDAAADYSVKKSTMTSGQRKRPACLSSFLISAVGAAADHFVIEFAVNCWIIRRGPLDGVEDQPPSSFLILGWCYRIPFSLVYFPCLMVNEENQFLSIIIKLLEV
uniref:Uncharacterized protein n=1 Tax=Fagus sylvatica TaxID=28930 RepID=A0A2N9FH58_FAGSY